MRGRSLAMVRQVAQLSEGRLPLVAVGGIHSGDDAKACIDAGATLVQVFTGMIYRGPGLVAEVAAAI